MDVSEFVALAQRLADAARVQTLKYFRTGAPVFNKAGIWFDPVTDADREAERVMRQMITNVFPDHAILGEEFGETPGADDTQGTSRFRWVLDPIDGTRAFVCGVPSWMVLIGLEAEGQPVLGVLDQPFTQERWIGKKGAATYCRGEDSREIRTSGITDLARARITTTDPRRAAAYFNAHEAAAFAHLAEKSRLARFSLDAYGYALVACGEIDIVVESGLAVHDYTALGPVVTGAGGVFTNWSGDPVGTDERGEVLACATPELHEQAMAVLSETVN